MKQPYKSVLQRSDMCRFFKNKVGKVVRVTLLIDLLLLASLFFHHYCYLAEFESDKSQKAVKSDYLGSRKTNKGDGSVVHVPGVERYSDKEKGLEETLLSFLKHKYPALFFLILANVALGGVALYARLKMADTLRRLAKRRIRDLARVLLDEQVNLSQKKAKNKDLTLKLGAFKNTQAAQKRLGRSYEAYQSGKLEKISDLTKIMIHSCKNASFLSELETLKFLKEIQEASHALQKKEFAVVDVEEISFLPILVNAQKMLRWILVKNNIEMTLQYDCDQDFSVSTNPFLMEVLIIGFLKSILFYLYRGSKVSLSLQKKGEQIDLHIHLEGHMIHDWYPLEDVTFDYGAFTLQGSKIHGLSRLLKTSVCPLSKEDFLITIASLEDGAERREADVVQLYSC